ncbi:MAG: hypothetical protein IBJ10_09620 [Phycisphaerales bacterium]|nr:hypothetical protein [Phycisphaerales bacterium]
MPFPSGLTAAAAAMFLGAAASAQCTPFKAVGLTQEHNGWAGESVAVQGGLMLLGEPNAGFTDYGWVSILERDAMGEWLVVGTVQAPNTGNNANDRLGTAVALSGGVILAGGPYGGANDAGMVCFFENTGPYQWTFKTSHTPADSAPLDNFGRALAMDGDFAVVGAPFHDKVEGLTLADTGGAYFFKRNMDGTWSPDGKASEPFTFLRAAHDHFGASVAMKGDLAIIGCPDGSQAGPADAGWVRVYQRAGGVWSVLTTLTAPGGGQAGGGFGRSLAYDGEFLVVGAPDTDFVSDDAGVAHVYRRSGVSFIYEGQLNAEFPDEHLGFGYRVTVANARIAVTKDERSVDLFSRTVGGSWVRHRTLTDPDGAHRFGFALAAQGDDLIVGDPYDSTQFHTESGAAYRYGFGFGADLAANAARLRVGDVFSGCTTNATNDGSASCGSTSTTRDVWYALTVAQPRPVAISTFGSSYDTVLSVHSAAPGNAANQIACNDDFAPPARWSRLTFQAQPGMIYYVRVSGWNGASGEYALAATSTISCPGDADGDGHINFNDLNAALSAFNTTGLDLPADFDLDGDVDFADLNIIISGFNTSCP